MKKLMIVGLLVFLVGCEMLIAPKFIAQGENVCEVNGGVKLFWARSYQQGKTRGTVVCRNGARFTLRY